MNHLVAIIGPTAVGKSRLAIHLAGLCNGEIVSADSRQVYRYMDIGTDKPSGAELARVPHHLVGIIEPDEAFSLAQFQALAYEAIDDIFNRRRVPFLVGGSGLYVKAVLEGWRIPGVSPDPEFRYNREQKANEDIAGLYQELIAIDPDAAAKIDRRNVRRVIRALEVFSKARRPFSELGQKRPPPFDAFIIGLTAARPLLYRLADRRIENMMARGFVGEVERLLKMGYSLTLPSMSGIGYREVGQVIKGELDPEDAVRKMKTGTHRFIRHQYAWFRLDDPQIHWFDIERQGYPEIETALAGYMEKE